MVMWWWNVEWGVLIPWNRQFGHAVVWREGGLVVLWEIMWLYDGLVVDWGDLMWRNALIAQRM